MGLSWMVKQDINLGGKASLSPGTHVILLVVKVLHVSRRDSAMTSAAFSFQRIQNLIILSPSQVKLLQARRTPGTRVCQGSGCST